MWDVQNLSGAKIIVNGSETNLEVGTSFREAVKNAAQAAGYSRFRVLVDACEIDPDDTPDTIESDMVVEILPYDKPACN